MRLFRGLSEAIIGKCLTVELVGYVEDPSLVSASTTPFQSSAGRSTSGMGQGPFVMDCGALEGVQHAARAGAILLLFSFLSFPCLPMHLCVCLSLPPVFDSILIDAGTSARPASGNCRGPLMMLLIRKKTVYKRCRMKCQAVCFKQRSRLFYANFQFTSTAS